jgi:mRNA interferase RelE/StbE
MKIIIRPSFYNDLAKIINDDAKIIEALRDLAKSPSLSKSNNLKKLKGSENHYRCKVGKYRIILSWDKKQQTLVVEAVGHRKDIYKK